MRKPCPAIADGGISEAALRPPLTLAMAARRHAQVRQVALVLYLQCQPAGPSLRRVHISRCWLPATSAVAMRCPGLPWLGQHSPCAYAVWSCQIMLQSRPLAACC
ncbi:hypothetical protein V8E51_002538 [Hyaloscypha variabilis]